MSFHFNFILMAIVYIPAFRETLCWTNWLRNVWTFCLSKRLTFNSFWSSPGEARLLKQIKEFVLQPKKIALNYYYYIFCMWGNFLANYPGVSFEFWVSYIIGGRGGSNFLFLEIFSRILCFPCLFFSCLTFINFSLYVETNWTTLNCLLVACFLCPSFPK